MTQLKESVVDQNGMVVILFFFEWCTELQWEELKMKSSKVTKRTISYEARLEGHCYLFLLAFKNAKIKVVPVIDTIFSFIYYHPVFAYMLYFSKMLLLMISITS